MNKIKKSPQKISQKGKKKKRGWRWSQLFYSRQVYLFCVEKLSLINLSINLLTEQLFSFQGIDHLIICAWHDRSAWQIPMDSFQGSDGGAVCFNLRSSNLQVKEQFLEQATLLLD